MFYKSDSGSEVGTTKASMNRTRKTNASAGPKRKYNEYKDFHQCELEGHICAAFLEMSGMVKADGIVICEIVIVTTKVIYLKIIIASVLCL